MKTLFIIESLMGILFIAATNKVQAQKAVTIASIEPTVKLYLRNRVSSESGGSLSLAQFVKVNGYEQGYGIYVIEWGAEIHVEKDCYKADNNFSGFWADFSVLDRQPGSLDSLIEGTATRRTKGTIIYLAGTSTQRKTEKGWRIEDFSVKRSRVVSVGSQTMPLSEKETSMMFSDSTRYDGGIKDGKPDGKGVITFPDGRKQTGIWAAGRFLGNSKIPIKITVPPPYKSTITGTTPKTGTFAINPIFNYADDFSEGLAETNDGYIDKTGKLVIKTHFGAADNFHEGLAPVLIGDKFSYINKTGNIILFLPQLAGAFGSDIGFTEGLTPALDRKTGKWGFIDKTGKFVASPTFNEAHKFAEGFAGVKIKNHFGFTNKSGKIVITPQFSAVSSFSEGFVAVRIGDEKTGKWGFIDKSGKIVITPQFDRVWEGFADGICPVYEKNNRKWGFIDKSGKIIITPQFDIATPISEGLARVRIGDEKTGKWGYIDKTGKIVITPQFDNAFGFSEGLASVRIGDDKTGKWGFIDKTGKIVISPQFDFAVSFSEGLARVRIGDDKTGKWGYIYR